MMPVLALALGMILSAIRGGSQDPIVALVITFVNVAIITTGAVFALIALLGIPRYGRKQILAPALIGLVLNLLFLAMFWGAWNNWRRGASTTTTTSTTKNVSAAITALSTADFGFDRGTWYSTPPRNDDVP
jgi:hypothetical protein